MELNLKIVKLQLKAKPSTLPKFREQCVNVVENEVRVVASAVMDCSTLF